MKKLHLLVAFLILISAQSSFAVLSCQSQFIDQDSQTPGCKLQIYSDTDSDSLDGNVTDFSKEECENLCSQEQVVLQPELATFAFKLGVHFQKNLREFGEELRQWKKEIGSSKK
jgi:hypothetical protein